MTSFFGNTGAGISPEDERNASNQQARDAHDAELERRRVEAREAARKERNGI